MSLPGIPVVWAGDEFGLTGADGEESRTPIPWARRGCRRRRSTLYRRLIALKRAHPALNGGGIRWLSASDDAVAFVRESAEECVVVVATRAATEVDLTGELPDDAVLLEGDAEWSAGRVRSTGPRSSRSRLPGIELPEWGSA